jgi:starch synthase
MVSPEPIFWEAIERALEVYRDKQLWTRLQRSGMSADFSWHPAALQYEALYRRALSFKGGW